MEEERDSLTYDPLSEDGENVNEPAARQTELHVWRSVPFLGVSGRYRFQNNNALHDKRTTSLPHFPLGFELLQAEDDADNVRCETYSNPLHPFKNLLVVCVGHMLFSVAYISLRNLQSSMNHEKGLGLTSLACIYGGFVFGCIFTTAIVHRFGPKFTLIIAILFHIAYSTANAFPSFYTLVPASAIAGISQAAMWTALGTYMTHISKVAAQIYNKSIEGVSSKYFGMLFLFDAIARVIGSLVTSLMMELAPLVNANTTTKPNLNTFVVNDSYDALQSPFSQENISILLLNASSPSLISLTTISSPVSVTTLQESDLFIPLQEDICGPNFCHYVWRNHNSFDISSGMRFLLTGIFSICLIFSVLLIAFFMDAVYLTRKIEQDEDSFTSDLIAVLRLWTEPEWLLLTPLIIYCGVLISFISADVTKAFMTCYLGIDVIGYLMTCFGICAAIGSFASGYIVPITGRTSIYITVTSINLGALVWMRFWRLSIYNNVLVFLLSGILGLVEGIWTTHTNSLPGILFPLQAEAAYSNFQLVIALAMMTGYSYAHELCMTEKIYLNGAACITAIISFLVLGKIKRRSSSIAQMD